MIATVLIQTKSTCTPSLPHPRRSMVLGPLTRPASVPWSFLIISGLLGLALVWKAARLLEWLWWRPRRLERDLRAQGLRGTSYRFLVGDVRDYFRQNKEAWSRPLPLRCHDIGPHVRPFLYSNIQEHGKTFVSWFGPVPKVTIVDPDLTKEVMSNKSGHFEKFKLPVLPELLTEGLANCEGDKWAKHRRILNPAFHLEKVKVVSRWTQSLGSDGCCEMDVFPELQSLAGDVISRAVFGSSYLEGRKIFKLQTEQVQRFMSSFQKMVIPGYMSLPTKNNRRMYQIKNEIESILRGFIEKRMQAMQGEENTKDDLLGLLLESNVSDKDGKGNTILGMKIEEVIEECKLFYFAGTETTSLLLTWTMVLLSMHPEWQERARDEILGMFEKNKVDFEGLSRLKTVTMILYEVLRLYPPAVALNRKTCQEIELGGIKYPAGVNIEMPVVYLHHNPDIWGNDVHEFKPERFAEGISKASKNPGVFLPFGWGPRICIGQNFALLEAKIALCMILQHFEFELAPSYTHAPYTLIMLCPMYGAQMKVRAI